MRNSCAPKLCQLKVKRWLVVMGLIATTLFLCQTFMLPYGNALRSLFTIDHIILEAKDSSKKLTDDTFGVEVTDTATTSVSNEPGIDGIYYQKRNIIHDEVMHTNGQQNVSDLEDESIREIAEFVTEVKFDDDFKLDDNLGADNTSLESTTRRENENVLESDGETRHGISVEQIKKPDSNISADTNPKEHNTESLGELHRESASVPLPVISLVNNSYSKYLAPGLNISSSGQVSLPTDRTNSEHNLISMTNIPILKKKSCDTPPKSVTSIDEMNRIFIRNRRASRSMKPLWSSACDKEILAAKERIQNAPVVRADNELYGPLFRNVSTFKRSYELMERVLKVYVYKEGQKPIFHQPIMKGLYASEGWFMKLMENNKHFIVKDPKREYTETIASKYPFWNRTGGSDHFLVACHDWAPYETRHHMENCIKALCNAAVSSGFKIGRDVSLPETYVRSQRNPQRDLGGKPASQRDILAFYAGSLHGYLRPILLKYWKDKDPDMKIFGRMPLGVASKMNYINYMKSSKYCICPKGYEVNSPRVVEAIFYECVPVIISDNFVPPLFDVLNWETFSIIVEEKDIPNLKVILTSIPESKYLELQLAVRRAQRHFLWHAKPLKYDLFHMILHSIWNNRVFQIK